MAGLLLLAGGPSWTPSWTCVHTVSGRNHRLDVPFPVPSSVFFRVVGSVSLGPPQAAASDSFGPPGGPRHPNLIHCAGEETWSIVSAKKGAPWRCPAVRRTAIGRSFPSDTSSTRHESVPTRVYQRGCARGEEASRQDRQVHIRALDLLGCLLGKFGSLLGRFGSLFGA